MKDITAQILNPKNMVEYQDGSVVSRQIVKGANGDVTLFAFDRGGTLSEHTAPFDALIHIIEGKARITIEKEVFSPETGDMLILPAGKVHSVSAEEQFKMLLVMIRR